MHGKGEIMGRWMKKIKNKQYGQAMAEFALTLPVFLMLIFGVIELSRFFLVYSSVFTASREASRFASSVGQSGNENYMNCQAIVEVATDMGFFGGVSDGDVKIYYESTPGYIEGSCFKITESGTDKYIPVKGNCFDGSLTCSETTPRLFPELGYRVRVDINTTYRPIAGIIPEIPVVTSNGRTIMMEIKRTPLPMVRELCDDFVSFKQEDPQLEGDYSLYVEIENSSKTSDFQIFSIENITWDSSYHSSVGLIEIYWDDALIWPKSIEDEYETLPFDITDDYFTGTNRNLGSEDTTKLKFVFDSDISTITDFDFSFYLILQNASLLTDYCDPVDY